MLRGWFCFRSLRAVEFAPYLNSSRCQQWRQSTELYFHYGIGRPHWTGDGSESGQREGVHWSFQEVRVSWPASSIPMTLTRRRVSPEDIQACENKYNKSKMVHSILRHVAETTSSHKLDELYEVVWHFLRSPLLITSTDSWMATVQGIWSRVWCLSAYGHRSWRCL